MTKKHTLALNSSAVGGASVLASPPLRTANTEPLLLTKRPNSQLLVSTFTPRAARHYCDLRGGINVAFPHDLRPAAFIISISPTCSAQSAHSNDTESVEEYNPGLPDSGRATLGFHLVRPSLSRAARRAKRVSSLCRINSHSTHNNWISSPQFFLLTNN